ncbi:MAG: hypothetical protein WKG00_38665 [Polyangiaceae bacterium]
MGATDAPPVRAGSSVLRAVDRPRRRPLAAPGPPLNTTSNGRSAGDSSAGWNDQNSRARPVKRGARWP